MSGNGDDERKRRRHDDESDEAAALKKEMRSLRNQQQSSAADIALLSQLQERSGATQPQPQHAASLPQKQQDQRQVALHKISSLTDDELERELRSSEMQLELLRKEQLLQEEQFRRERQQLQRLDQQRLLSGSEPSADLADPSEDILLLRRIREEQRTLEEQMQRLDSMSMLLRQGEGSGLGGIGGGVARRPFPLDNPDDLALATSSARLREMAAVGGARDLPLGLSAELEALNRLRGGRLDGLPSYSAAVRLPPLGSEFARGGQSSQQSNREGSADAAAEERAKILRDLS